MKHGFVTFVILSCLTYIHPVFASEDAGSRAAYTRLPYAGGSYVSFGCVGEAVANDVFSLYWNPAGLSEISRRTMKSAEEINQSASTGDVSGITETDLLAYDGSKSHGGFSAGASASTLGLRGNTFFAGTAFSAFSGGLGLGAYSFHSPSIDEYDESGKHTGTGYYNGSEAFISYGKSAGFSSVGFSVKGLFEKISDYNSAGAALDIGVMAEPFPFLKLGFVAQDIAIVMTPTGEGRFSERDFGSALVRMSVAFDSRAARILVGFGMERKIEQEGFSFKAGVKYDPTDSMSISIGFADTLVTAGAGWKFAGLDTWYAFAYDRAFMQGTHTVSMGVSL